jgi:DNA anti-recombination protein RmuC
MGFARGATGPKAGPGSYQVEIVNGRTTLTQVFELLPDARTGATAADYREGFELAMQVRDKLSELHEGVNKMRAVRKQVEAWSERLGDEGVTKAGEALKERLREVEDELIQWRAKAGQDTLNFPVKLNAKLAALIGSINGMEGKPTEQSREVFADLSGKVDTQLKQLDAILKEDVPGFNAKVKAVAADAIAL